MASQTSEIFSSNPLGMPPVSTPENSVRCHPHRFCRTAHKPKGLNQKNPFRPSKTKHLQATQPASPITLNSMLDPTATLIIDWLRAIGLTVRFTPLDPDESPTFLPGLTIEPNGLAVDPDRLLYPGDLLHEAGHLAVMLPEQRASTSSNAGSNMGDEIAAQCWSYAATVHLGLPPETVFHANGYKGSATKLAEIYSNGDAGVPLLQWMGLTLDRKRAKEQNAFPYPHMLRWLRTPAPETRSEPAGT